jgi:cell division protein FtsZ
MEVDEAASHIKELVDPDANIIWGSAFNNELEGKIRVSVVATGIDAEAVTQAPPLPAKVFTFPGAARAAASPAEAAKITLTPPEPAEAIAEAAAEEAEAAALSVAEGEAPAEAPTLEAADEAEAADELLLDTGAMLGEDDGGESFIEEGDRLAAGGPESSAPGTRSWIGAEEDEAAAAAEPRPAREGGTLFERMSSIARGAAKAQVEEEPQPRLRRDPLDIPRFLGRQNNQ